MTQWEWPDVVYIHAIKGYNLCGRMCGRAWAHSTGTHIGYIHHLNGCQTSILIPFVGSNQRVNTGSCPLTEASGIRITVWHLTVRLYNINSCEFIKFIVYVAVVSDHPVRASSEHDVTRVFKRCTCMYICSQYHWPPVIQGHVPVFNMFQACHTVLFKPVQ